MLVVLLPCMVIPNIVFLVDVAPRGLENAIFDFVRTCQRGSHIVLLRRQFRIYSCPKQAKEAMASYSPLYTNLRGCHYLVVLLITGEIVPCAI